MKKETAETAVQMYLEESPTIETTVEIVNDIADHLGESANAVRMELIKANVLVKRTIEKAAEATTKAKSSGTGTKRVSKEDSLNALKQAITDSGGELDDEIISKLTGKVAIYFTTILNNIKGE